MAQLIATLIKGDQVSPLTDYRDALPVNMYAVKRPVLNADGYMVEYPGLTSYATGFGVDRGAVYNERLNQVFRISGQRLICIQEDGTIDNLGEITGIDQATLIDAYSFNTQSIIADGKMYLYEPVGGLQQVVDPNLGSPIDCVWIDGYYFLTDGEYLYHTDLVDETLIDPLRFATAEFMPDPSLALGRTQDNKVMVFGRYSIEYFVNSATANFAFQRVGARALKIGVVATHAKCETKMGWYITGGRKNESLGVHLVGVGAATKISTREVDDILAQYSEAELQHMRMETRIERDTAFIIINLPNETLCFSETIAQAFGVELAWTLLKSDTTGDRPYRGINGIFDPRNSTWILGDKFSDMIGALDHSINTHYGENVEWLLFTPFFKMETFSINELTIETIPGFNTINDATVAISTTQDGITYSKEYWLEYGRKGNYNPAFTIRRLGYVSDIIGFKLRGISSTRVAFATMRVIYG